LTTGTRTSLNISASRQDVAVVNKIPDDCNGEDSGCKDVRMLFREGNTMRT
jgi:hypothetical protein